VAAGSDERIVALERTARELGAAVWATDRDWCLDRVAEFYEGGGDAFDELSPDQLLAAQLWFLLDCPLPDGETPLWRLGREAPGRPVELLGRSELRAWRVEAVAGSATLGALCPLGTGPALLELCSKPVGELVRGAFVVGRCVPLGPQRWLLLGGAVVVDRAAARDFEALIATLDAPRGELWRVHGGVLARAAWAWPERRERTLEGDVVQMTIGTLELPDQVSAVAALDDDVELRRAAADDGTLRWGWCWEPPIRRVDRPPPGISYELPAEDLGADPRLAELEAGSSGGFELRLSALTPARYRLAERLLRARLGSLVGDLRSLSVGPRSSLPRWRAPRGDGMAHGRPSEVPLTRAA
jgi:hypothetical protein